MVIQKLVIISLLILVFSFFLIKKIRSRNQLKTPILRAQPEKWTEVGELIEFGGMNKYPLLRLDNLFKTKLPDGFHNIDEKCIYHQHPITVNGLTFDVKIKDEFLIDFLKKDIGYSTTAVIYS